MHLLISLVLIFGFSLLLVVGLFSVLQDLLERDFYIPPVIAERDSYSDHYHPVVTVANSPNGTVPEASNSRTAFDQRPVRGGAGRPGSAQTGSAQTG
jgi:hypothetical protein